MGFLVGTLKFFAGLVLGSVTGAAVATLIVTRNGQETIEKLRGVLDEVVSEGRAAVSEEESRMMERRQQLIGNAGEERRIKQLQKAQDKEDEKKADKKDK